MDCIFCKIINGDIPSYTYYEDDIVKVFLDIKPSTNGDSLIVPKKHYKNIEDIDIDTLNHINRISKEIYPKLKNALNCKGLTLVQNNDYGQEIKHYHLHLTPRYESDNIEITFSKEGIVSLEEIYTKLKQD